MSVAISLLELAAELGRLHERSGRGTITVIPVIVDNLVAAMPVLRSLSEITDGVLLDANDASLQRPVLGTDDLARRTAVKTALQSLSSASAGIEIVDLDEGIVDARFEGSGDGGEPSPGQRALLGIARAVVHRDLDSHEIGIITYRDTSIDFPFKRSVWNLAVRQLSGMPSGTLRTLVFVAESAISVDLHCQRARGFRLAMDADRLLRRHGDDDLRAWSRRIASSDAPIVLFLGAGFSASSMLPLGNSLRNRAIRRLLDIDDLEIITEVDLCGRFYDWISERPGWLTDSEERMGRDAYIAGLTLEQVVRVEKRHLSALPTLQYFRELHDSIIDTPGPAVVELAQILQKSSGKIIIAEVNFDRLVEVHSPVALRSFASDEDFGDADAYVSRYLAGLETDIPLLKLHGSIERPETCVVSDEQTEAGIGEGKLRAIRALYSDSVRKRMWIYIGASMRDRDLLAVFRDSDFANGTDEGWVAPYLADTVEEFARSRWAVWKHRDRRSIDERFISETADTFFEALRSAWDAQG
jgi:hypothetical protein